MLGALFVCPACRAGAFALTVMLDSHDDDEERVFREHIRSLLFEYAFTHLTVDHAQFTSDAVSEVGHPGSPCPVYSFPISCSKNRSK